MAAAITNDLVVVGPGELGYRVAMIWKAAHPKAAVYLKTRSEKEERSERWRSAGFLPAASYDGVGAAPYVVFSAPPTGSLCTERHLWFGNIKLWLDTNTVTG